MEDWIASVFATSLDIEVQKVLWPIIFENKRRGIVATVVVILKLSEKELACITDPEDLSYKFSRIGEIKALRDPFAVMKEVKEYLSQEMTTVEYMSLRTELATQKPPSSSSIGPPGSPGIAAVENESSLAAVENESSLAVAPGWDQRRAESPSTKQWDSKKLKTNVGETCKVAGAFAEEKCNVCSLM